MDISFKITLAGWKKSNLPICSLDPICYLLGLARRGGGGRGPQKYISLVTHQKHPSMFGDPK